MVAPLAGARIEIVVTGNFCYISKSPLSQGRELKWNPERSPSPCRHVAPLAGARIEIDLFEDTAKYFLVAPLAGARIEIVCTWLLFFSWHVAPLAGARIEIAYNVFAHNRTSRPSRRGEN